MRHIEFPVSILAFVVAIVGCTRIESSQPSSARDPEKIVLCGTGDAGPVDLVQAVVQRCRAGEWVRVELSGFLRGSELLAVCDLTAPMVPTVTGISDEGAVICRYRGEPREVWLVRENDPDQVHLLQPFGTDRTMLR